MGRDAQYCDLDRVVGACAICPGTGGLVTIGRSRLSLCWVAVTVWVRCASVILPTLGIGISTLGIGATTPGMYVACRDAWVEGTLLQLALAFAASFFAIAILGNSLLTFCNASAVIFPVGMFPWSAIVSCCAAATTWDSGEMVGIVMY